MEDDQQTNDLNQATDDQQKAMNNMASAGDTAEDTMKKKVADELMNQDIMKILKFDSMPEEKQEEIKKKMIDTILGRMIARIMDALSVDNKKAFEEVLDKNDEKATEEFLKDKVNIRDILVQETLLYKAEMIDNAQKIDEMVKSNSGEENTATTDTDEEPSTAIV